MKLYNDQRNAQSLGYGVSARALTPYLNHCRSCTPASEDGLIESPKRVRQKKIDKLKILHYVSGVPKGGLGGSTPPEIPKFCQI
jgi:hypothetical protein